MEKQTEYQAAIIIEPVKPYGTFEMTPGDAHNTFVFQNKTLERALSFWPEHEDWETYCKRYGINDTIDFSIGDINSDPLSADFNKIDHESYRFYADLTIGGKLHSVFIKDVPDLFDFMHYVGSTIKLVAQSKYRIDQMEGTSELGTLKVEGWGIGTDENNN